jgi:hypothetical protein
MHNPPALIGTDNFWTRASTGRKVAYVAGGVAGVTAVTMLVRWAMRPDPFSTVSPQCNDFAFGDRGEINDAIRPMVRAAARKGAVDPFAVASDFVRRYTDCHSYPQNARNPGEAELYVSSFGEVLRVMEEEQLLSPEQKTYFSEMVAVWGRAQGLSGGGA